ncbi:MAG TPA: efflux RND transporter permease subunit, partial [Spirochaetia bacterium]|nr:efflux RND transporter permease subunit [Spirochaetia bacterium]
MLDQIFRRKSVFLLFVALLCALGAVLLTRLPVQLYPQTQRPRISLRVNHAGYSALDFSRQYGADIEARLLAVGEVDTLEAVYEDDSSSFTLTFNWSVESETAKASVESAMNTIETILPSDIRNDYTVRFFAGENAGFLLLGLTSVSTPPDQLYGILKTSIEPELTQVEDAELVEIYNIEDLEVKVEVRQADMLAYGLTIVDVDAAMTSGYLPDPVGNLAEGTRRYIVRHTKDIDSVRDVGKIIIVERGNVLVRLQDIADISIAYAPPSQALVIDGQSAVRINATPKDGGNIRKMSEDIQQILTRARAAGVLPSDTVFQLYLDPAQYINRSIQNVVRSALLGALLAMFIVFITLGEARNTILIGISLPLSIVLSFILLAVFNVSLNLISLGGIALAVGMVIDSSIVVMENIHRHYDECATIADRPALKRVIMSAVDQVRNPVIGSTVTTILVFLPISFTAPLTNAILGDQAKAVVFALVFSLIVALTVIPLLAFLIYRLKDSNDPTQSSLHGMSRVSSNAMQALDRLYKRSLRAVISRPWRAAITVAGSFGILWLAVWQVLPLIPKEIISPPSSDRIVVFFRSPDVTDRAEIVETVVPELERIVREKVGDSVKSTYATVSGRHNILFVNLKSTSDAQRILGELQRAFVSDNTFYYNVAMWDPAQLPLPRTMDLQISVRGADDRVVVGLLEQVRDIVNETDLYGRVFTDPQAGLSDELSLSVRAGVIDRFPGFTRASLVALVRKVLRGTTPIEFEEGQGTIEVSAVYPEDSISSRDKLANLLIPTKNGIVPLKHFFDFHVSTGVAGIASENGQKIFRVYARMPANTPAADRGKFESVAKKALDEKLKLPAGYSIMVENPQVELDAAIRSLFFALIISVALIYLVVALQFNSLGVPFVILVTIPLGFTGVVASLYLFHSTLSLNSMLGTILLAGIVVNNAIIMIDFYRKMADDYSDKVDALVATAGLRFRPILITTFTTILGMLPLAIGLGEGSNIVQPLGIAVSGGLLVSTLF